MGGHALAALVGGVAWLALVALVFVVTPDGPGTTDPLAILLMILCVALPVALIWAVAAALRTARALGAESTRLRSDIEALRHAQATPPPAPPMADEIAAALGEIAAGQRALEARIAALAVAPAVAATKPLAPPRRPPPAPPPRPAAAPQPKLALGDGAEPQALPAEDFVRAVDFPRDARDREGFAVLRRALDHHPTGQVVTAAQDVLTLLSQDGIFMDDLETAPATPATWRIFAEGARGPQVAAMASIRDRSALTIAATRMREDTVFRDAVHHFLRAFDRALADFAAGAADAELAALSDTRSGRAFALMGRVAGLFD